MNVLIIGSGGREHGLAWKIAQSPMLDTLYCAPGNAGIGEECTLVALDPRDHAGITDFCRQNQIGLVVIGPEAPLVAGLADDLDQAGILAFGPSAAAAQLEGSKGFTKEFCTEFGIATAAFQRFNNGPKARRYVREIGAPIVIKADGLAAGKGVVVAHDLQTALDAIDDFFEGGPGTDQGIVIEEFLVGEEASLFALCDGACALLLGTAQDHKQAHDGDTGPNTGGMGAYSPAPILDQAMIDEVMTDIIVPTLAGMHARGTPFTGILYAGLMITADGPKLIEYNVRFGDPECQPVMMRLRSDLLALLLASCDGTLLAHEAQWHDHAALCVVMAAKGYPGVYQQGDPIGIPQELLDNSDLKVFHAGTARLDSQLIAAGGRVLGVTAMAGSVTSAQQRAYQAVNKIDWPGGFNRTDIGWRAVAVEAKENS